MTATISNPRVLLHKLLLCSVKTTVLCLLASCSTQATYDKVPTSGRFSGEPRMVALAPNTFFFFQPEHKERFSFTTHRRGDPALQLKGGRGSYRWPEWRIEPEEMITNGASIPRNLWYVPGFAPFDFTRAAVIHDWLFEAHHRYIMAQAALIAAKARHDRQAIRRSEAEKEAYKSYAKIDQNDAADIFAECIKVAMVQSRDIVRALERFPMHASDPDHPSVEAFKELKDALHYNREDSRTLWAYHYFVSPDAIVKTSEKLWKEPHCTIETYRFLTSPAVKKVALAKGYLSPWLMEKFEKILAREERRHQDFRRAQPQTPTLSAAAPSSAQKLSDEFPGLVP